MTAPDPGLTDLIAAHTRLGAQQVGRYLCLCGWVGDYHDHSAHVALVVEQHTNRRITALEAELEKQKRGGRTLGKAIDRTLKWVIEASNSEDLIGDDGDGDWEIVWDRLFQLRPARDAAIARAEKAEATIARVRVVEAEYLDPEDADIECREDVWRFIRDLRAALEGES